LNLPAIINEKKPAKRMYIACCLVTIRVNEYPNIPVVPTKTAANPEIKNKVENISFIN